MTTNSEYFPTESPRLFGIHHPPVERRDGEAASCVKSVLVCPPIGHEYLRTHWSLRVIAKRLARQGCHVFRFDYRGIGDSIGEPQDVVSIEEWASDVSMAVDKLKSVSGAETVMLMGLRTGAMIAAEAARSRRDISSIVAWEPVLDGRVYLRALRSMHQKMIDYWYRVVPTDRLATSEELLGTCYRRELLVEIEAWEFDLGTLEIPQLVVLPAQSESSMPTAAPTWQKRLLVDDDPSWDRLGEMELSWRRPRTSQKIVELIDDMFVRLQQRHMLSGEALSGGGE
ncbi:MAG: alpha/beta fold hydrolase [Planctomycetota bacterium]